MDIPFAFVCGCTLFTGQRRYEPGTTGVVWLRGRRHYHRRSAGNTGVRGQNLYSNKNRRNNKSGRCKDKDTQPAGGNSRTEGKQVIADFISKENNLWQSLGM